MKKILSIAFLALLFASCKGNTKTDSDKNLGDQLNIKLVKDSSVVSVKENKEHELNNDNAVANYWAFYKISESSITGIPKKTESEIINKFKNIKIEIDEKNVKVGNLCSFEYYKSNKTPVKYYESTKTAKLYESIFLKNGLKLGNSLSVYQSLYPEKSCEIPWDELLVVDNTLVIVFDDYLVFFKKGNNIDQNDCYSKTKITSLPITKNVINGNNIWNQLDCTIANLDTKDYLRLPDIKDIKVFIIGNFNFDDFTYTLVTLKNNIVISKRDIGFVKEGDNGNTISEFTEFEINKNYVFNLDTKIKKGEDFKVLKEEKFKIDENGLIVVVK
ncbi:hypothetical protein OIU83_04690 [Flavobacterium sp. LS1R49]|uniref:Lipoprotein n=1 Tax=Flavobacterium shii TaxID=2987687 RepID=A0A9X2ZFZ1_9FLAO|nr:hypothetical protein [Flavobacterium shii]MCV9926933.1 hypothetical protein [Flavobacterium shii]